MSDSYFFRHTCPVCGTRRAPTDSDPLCPACRAAWAAEQRRTCKRCGRRMAHCVCAPETILSHPYPIFTLAPYRADSIAMRLVLLCKRRRGNILVPSLVDDMLARLAEAGVTLGQACLLVPVPRSPKNFRILGQDTANAIARQLSARTGIPLLCCLRNRGKHAQKTFSRIARLQNAALAYRARPNIETVRAKTVLLIDDVCTSGGTLAAAYALLRQSGAARVFCITIAKAGT